MLKFIEELHGLPALTDRDKPGVPLSGAFDFTRAAATQLPEAPRPHLSHLVRRIAALGLVALLPLLVAAKDLAW